MSSEDGSASGAPDVESTLVAALGFEPTSGLSDDAVTVLVDDGTGESLDWKPPDAGAQHVHDRIELTDGDSTSSPPSSTVKADDAMTPPKGKGKGPKTFSQSKSKGSNAKSGAETSNDTRPDEADADATIELGTSANGDTAVDAPAAPDDAVSVDDGSSAIADDPVDEATASVDSDGSTDSDGIDDGAADHASDSDPDTDSDPTNDTTAGEGEGIVVGADPAQLVDADSSGVHPILGDDADTETNGSGASSESSGSPSRDSASSGYPRGGRYGGHGPTSSPASAKKAVGPPASGPPASGILTSDTAPSDAPPMTETSIPAAASTAAAAAAVGSITADEASTPAADNPDPPPPIIEPTDGTPSAGAAPETIVVDGLTLNVSPRSAAVDAPDPTGELTAAAMATPTAPPTAPADVAVADATVAPVLDPPPPLVGDPVPTSPPTGEIAIPGPATTARVTTKPKPQGDLAARIPSLLDQKFLRRTRRVRARKVRRVVRHIDPWSVLTFSVLFFLCIFAALLLASVLVWNAAVQAGTIENIESFIVGIGDYQTFEIKGDVVFRAAMVIAGILTLAASVMLVLLVVVFNLISDLVGGIRVTVVEEETVRVRRKRNR